MPSSQRRAARVFPKVYDVPVGDPATMQAAGATGSPPQPGRRGETAAPSGPAGGGGDRRGQRPAPKQAAGVERLETRLAAYLSRSRPRVVVTDNVRTMVTIKRGRGVTTFRLHHMFLDAPPKVVRALARYAEGRDRDASTVLRSYVDANEHRIRRVEQPRRPPCDPTGRYHDLAQIFDELNAAYFGGRIQASITWGRRMRRRRKRSSIRLGSYDFEARLITIHPVLDAPDVPRFYVAWVVYHEMLHEVHDIPIKDGRRIYHTPAFRRAETRFARYAEAVMWERANVDRLLER